MRELVLILSLLAGLGMTLRWPFVGILLWTWFACMQPHEEAYDFANLPLNVIIVAVTALSWLLSRRRMVPPVDAILIVGAVFLFWATINTVVAVFPAVSWILWDQTWKRLALGLAISAMATNKVRIHSVVCVSVISLLYFGVKGGLFTLESGGNYHVYGPANSMIADNNQLAAVLLMILPLANYVRLVTLNKWISHGILAGMMVTAVSILGSYSRGAYLAMAALAAMAWLNSRRKIAYVLTVGAVIIPSLLFMPQTFWDRLDSIQSAGTDDSFQARVTAWHVAYFYARDHFPFGAGFDGPQQPAIFNHYFPGAGFHAAHSIFFEVLGDNGFVGLALYLTLLVLAFVKASRVSLAARRHPELDWAAQLARMIQLSLAAFVVGGSALSLAYYDLLFIELALLIAMERVVRETGKIDASESWLRSSEQLRV